MRDMGTKAERIAEIDEMIAGLKEERTRLEGEFIAQAEDDIRDSKRKTAYYAGN